MKYKRLLAFGCSCTYGQGIEDCRVRDGSAPNPSKYAWPQVLADKLGIECVNLSKPGNSNKNIWWQILNTKIYEDDIVIPCWTFTERNSIITRDKHIDLQWWVETEESDFYFKYIHNTHDALIDLFIRYNHICLYLDSKNIKNLQLSIFNFPNTTSKPGSLYRTLPEWIPEWLDKRLLRKIKYTDLRKKYGTTSDGSHLDKSGNAEYANKIFIELQKQGII